MSKFTTTNELQFVQSPKEWKPHEYQLQAMRFLLEHNGAGLFLDPGLGKTSVSLGAIKILKKKGLFRGALLVAPLRVCYSVWPKEVTKWADFADLKVVLLHGPRKEALLKEKADIYIINPEGLEWLVRDDRIRRLPVDTLIVDESSKFKHTQTQRFKNLKPHLRRFTRRWILTGSPAPNGLLDLFGQIYIIDLGRALGPYITKYRQQFFIPTVLKRESDELVFKGQESRERAKEFTIWSLKPGAAEIIYNNINPIVLRQDAKELIDMPELIENDILIDLPDSARDIYDAIEQDMIVALEDGKIVTALSAASASTKCRQIANGGMYLNDVDRFEARSFNDEWEFIHNEKANLIADLVEELGGQPLLVAFEYRHDLIRLQRALGKDVPYVAGGVSAARGRMLEEAWNAGKLPVLLGHPQTLAHGLNLQEAGHHVAWHSLTWDFELYDQFNRRVWRQGNENEHVFVHHVIARNTVDEAVLGALRSKDKVQSRLLNALKRYAANRSK